MSQLRVKDIILLVSVFAEKRVTIFCLYERLFGIELFDKLKVL